MANQFLIKETMVGMRGLSAAEITTFLKEVIVKNKYTLLDFWASYQNYAHFVDYITNAARFSAVF